MHAIPKDLFSKCIRSMIKTIDELWNRLTMGGNDNDV